MGSVELDISAYHERNFSPCPAAIFSFPLPNHSHDLFFIADFHLLFVGNIMIIITTNALTQTVSIIIAPLLFIVNESEISHNVVLVFGFVDYNFFDFLALQVIDMVEFVSIPAAALKFESLPVVKHPVELPQIFIVDDIQDAQKLR